MDTDLVLQLAKRVRPLTAQDSPKPNAVLGTDSDGLPAWVQGLPMQVWTLDVNAQPGWRPLPLLGSIAYQAPVQPMPAPQGGLVQINLGTLVSLTAGMKSMQDQVETLRLKLNEEVAAREALNAELRRVNLMRAAPTT